MPELRLRKRHDADAELTRFFAQRDAARETIRPQHLAPLNRFGLPRRRPPRAAAWRARHFDATESRTRIADRSTRATAGQTGRRRIVRRGAMGISRPLAPPTVVRHDGLIVHL